jgi:hypothetical protein
VVGGEGVTAPHPNGNMRSTCRASDKLMLPKRGKPEHVSLIQTFTCICPQPVPVLW